MLHEPCTYLLWDHTKVFKMHYKRWISEMLIQKHHSLNLNLYINIIRCTNLSFYFSEFRTSTPSVQPTKPPSNIPTERPSLKPTGDILLKYLMMFCVSLTYKFHEKCFDKYFVLFDLKILFLLMHVNSLCIQKNV